MPGKSNKISKGAHLDDDLLYRHLEKKTTQEEEACIEQHLNSCNICFAEVMALTDVLQTPITESEKIEIAQSRKVSAEEQVKKVLKYIDDDRAVSAGTQYEELPAPDPFFGRQIISVLAALWRKRRMQLAFAFVAVFALIRGSYLGVNYHIASNHVQQAEKLLQDHYQVFFEDTPRLAGGYESKGISLLMDSTTAMPSYLQQASDLANTALQSGWKSDQARQLLAKVAIIEKNYGMADSLLRQLRPHAANSSEALNDLGVLYFEQARWDSAARYFAAAVAADPQFAEALYNLALIKAKLGLPAEAITRLDEFMKLEKDEGWRRAARELQKTQRRLSEK